MLIYTKTKDIFDVCQVCQAANINTTKIIEICLPSMSGSVIFYWEFDYMLYEVQCSCSLIVFKSVHGL